MRDTSTPSGGPPNFNQARRQQPLGSRHLADLADLAEAAARVSSAEQAFGRLDIVVNNVGGAVPRPFLETSTGDLEEALRFNVATTHALVRAAVPLMLGSDGGAVINISGVAGISAVGGLLSYGTADRVKRMAGALTQWADIGPHSGDLVPRLRTRRVGRVRLGYVPCCVVRGLGPLGGPTRSWRGVPIACPARRQVLAALLSRLGAVVSTAALVEDLWGQRRRAARSVRCAVM